MMATTVTLPPFANDSTVQTSSTSLISPRMTFKSTSVSLLPSDIEEDLELLDLNSNEFQYISKDEYWLYEDGVDRSDWATYKQLEEWIDQVATLDDDSFMKSMNSTETSAAPTLIKNILHPGSAISSSMHSLLESASM